VPRAIEYYAALGAPIAPRPFDPDSSYRSALTQSAPSFDDPTLPGPFSRGLVGGIRKAGGLLGSALELAGFEEAGREWREWGSQIPYGYERQVPAFTEIFKGKDTAENVSRLGTYVAETFGEGLPQLAPTVAAGLATGGIATVAGLGATAARVASLAGAFMPSYTMAAGEQYGELTRQGVPESQARPIALAAGLPIAALDVLPLERLIGHAARPGAGSLARRIARAAVVGVATEAPTEAAQEAIGLGVQAAVTGRPLLTQEAALQVAEAGVAGGIVGGGVGAGFPAAPARVEAEIEAEPRPAPRMDLRSIERAALGLGGLAGEAGLPAAAPEIGPPRMPQEPPEPAPESERLALEPVAPPAPRAAPSPALGEVVPEPREEESTRGVSARIRGPLLLDPVKLAELEPTPEGRREIDEQKVSAIAQKLRTAPDEVAPAKVEVGADGVARLDDGNHRVRAAIQAGLRALRTEVVYAEGGEASPTYGPDVIERALGPAEVAEVRRETTATEVQPVPAAAPAPVPRMVRPVLPTRPAELPRAEPTGAAPEPLPGVRERVPAPGPAEAAALPRLPQPPVAEAPPGLPAAAAGGLALPEAPPAAARPPAAAAETRAIAAEERAPYPRTSALGFYSRLARVTESIPQPMRGTDMLRYLSDPKRGVKTDELKWTGIDDLLRAKAGERVTPEEVQRFVRENQVDVQEVRAPGETSPELAARLRDLDEGRDVAFAEYQEARRALEQQLVESGMTPRRAEILSRLYTQNDPNILPEEIREVDVALGRVSPEGAPPAGGIESVFRGSGNLNRSADAWRRHHRLTAERARVEAEEPPVRRPKFSQWQLPGGENYREVMLTLPQSPLLTKTPDRLAKERYGKGWYDITEEQQRTIARDIEKAPVGFAGGHFEEPNVLAHVRLNDRTDVEGRRVLFVEEIQSDWAQRGREEGFVRPGARSVAMIDREMDDLHRAGLSPEEFASGLNALQAERNAAQGTVPAGPFVTDTTKWTELALKRILRMAAEGGYDRVAWTTGEQQADRYDLRKYVDEIRYDRNPNGTFRLLPYKDGAAVARTGLEEIAPEALAKAVGQDLAGKIIAGSGDVIPLDAFTQKFLEKGRPIDAVEGPWGRTGHGWFIRYESGETQGVWPSKQSVEQAISDQRELRQTLLARGETKSLKGIDLKVGGEGMRAFYDEIVPQVAARLGKKWGVKVGETTIGVRGTQPQERAKTEIGRQPSIDITSAMRQSVMAEGFALFEPRIPYEFSDVALPLPSKTEIAESAVDPRTAEKNADWESRSLTGKDVRLQGPQAPLAPAREVDTPVGRVWVGGIGLPEWLGRAEKAMGGIGSPEWTAAREWYRRLEGRFREIYGEREAVPRLMLWAISQQRASPSKGQVDTMRAVDKWLVGFKRVPTPWLGAGRLKSFLAGAVESFGFGQKLVDFYDSAMGFPTRSWTGGKGPFEPAAIDIWAARDIGFVDGLVQKWFRGLGIDAQLDILKDMLSRRQYFYGTQFYNELAAWLNEQEIDGGGWTAGQAQALGWVTIQRAMGATPESVTDIFQKNVREVTAEAAPGAGSPLANDYGSRFDSLEAAKRTEVTKSVFDALVPRVTQMANVQVVSRRDTSGAWGQWRSPNQHIRILGSPEAARLFNRLLGFATQQTQSFAFRMRRRGALGARPALRIWLRNSDALASPESAMAWWDAIVRQDPELERLTGASMISAYDEQQAEQPALLVVAPDERRLPKRPKRRKNEAAAAYQRRLKETHRFRQPMDVIKELVRLTNSTHGATQDIVLEHAGVETDVASNNWRKEPDGARYRASIARVRPELEGRPLDDLWSAAAAAYRDAFDAAERPVAPAVPAPEPRAAAPEVAAAEPRGPPEQPYRGAIIEPEAAAALYDLATDPQNIVAEARREYPTNRAAAETEVDRLARERGIQGYRGVRPDQAVVLDREGRRVVHVAPRTRAEAIEQGQLALLDLRRGPQPATSVGGALAKREPRAPRVLGRGIPERLTEHGFFDYHALRINNARDLALAAQVLRDPRFETFRLFAIGVDGRVLGHRAWSSRLPGVVVWGERTETHEKALTWLRDLGAAKVYMMHNHPSGVPQPSMPDIDMTRAFADFVGIAKITGGRAIEVEHIIIDSGTYGTISDEGAVAVRELNPGQPRPLDPLLTPSIEHAALGRVVVDARDVAVLGRSLHTDPSWIPIIMIDARQRVRFVAQIPEQLYFDQQELRKWLQHEALQSGASDAFAYISAEPRNLWGRSQRYVNDGLLTDVVAEGMGSTRQRLLAPEQAWMGQRIADVRGVRVLETRETYTPGEAEPLGAPKPPGEPPRVEQRVESVERTEAEAGIPHEKLDRETAQRWEDLDDDVRRVLRTYTDEDFAAKLREGRNLTTVEQMAWDARVRQKRETWEDLARQVAGARASGVEPALELQREYTVALLDYIAAERTAVNDGTAAARALASRRRVMLADPNDPALPRLLKEIPGLDDAAAAAILDAYRTHPEDLEELVRNAVPNAWWEKLLEFWKAGLLSAPKTDVANIFGNSSEVAIRIIETAVAGGLSKVLPGIEQRAGLEEMGAELTGIQQAFWPALQKFLRKAANPVARQEIDLARGRLEYQAGKIGGRLGRIVRWPFRRLYAADEMFRAIGSAADKHKLSWRKARRELGADASRGTVDARYRAILQELEDPTNREHKDIVEAVKKSSNARVFADDPWKWVSGLNAYRANNPWMHIVMPFTTTPANIARAVLRRSPFGFVRAARLYKQLRAGTSTSDEVLDALTSAVVGSMALGAFYTLAKSGLLTGSGPTDERERQLLRETGWQPYSFVFATTPSGQKFYVPFNRFEPVSSLLGFAADFAEATDAVQRQDLGEKFVGSLVSNLINKTFLTGLSEAAAMTADPNRFMGRYAANLAGSIVPNIIATAAQAADPKLRDIAATTPGLAGLPERMAKRVLSRLPLASTALPERLSATGEPIELPGGITRMILPVQVTKDKPGKALERLLVRVGYVPGTPQRWLSYRGQKLMLSSDEHEIMKAANVEAATRAKALLRAPGFLALPDSEDEGGEHSKEYELRRIFGQARARARKRVYFSPGFRRKMYAVRQGLSQTLTAQGEQ